MKPEVEPEKCPVHPKYKGKRKPTSVKQGCICARIWLRKQKKPRVLPMPTKVYKDKSKYDRKKKHKNKED